MKQQYNQSGISKVIIIIIAMILVIGCGVGGYFLVMKIKESQYKEGRELMTKQKPKEAYDKFRSTKDYGVKKEGARYYLRLANLALINKDREAAKQYARDGLKELGGKGDRDEEVIKQQLERTLAAAESPSGQLPKPNIEDIKQKIQNSRQNQQ